MAVPPIKTLNTDEFWSTHYIATLSGIQTQLYLDVEGNFYLSKQPFKYFYGYLYNNVWYIKDILFIDFPQSQNTLLAFLTQQHKLMIFK